MVVRATWAQGTAAHDRHKSAEKWDVGSLSPNLTGSTEIQLRLTLRVLQMEMQVPH